MAPETWHDPYPHYDRMREHDPVHLSDLGMWMLFGFDEVKTFYGDADRFKLSYELGQKTRFGDAVEDELWYQTFRKMIAFRDEPDHARIRRIFAGAFTPQHIASMRGSVESICDDLIEGLLPHGQMDLMRDFAIPLTIHRIGDLVGVDPADRDRIGDLAQRSTKVISFVPLTQEQLDDINEATAELVDYFASLAARIRSGNADNNSVFAAMVSAIDSDETMHEEELYANAIILYAAGFDTTSTALGLAMMNLWRHPDQLEIARSEPETLAATGVAELLRYDTSGQGISRMTVTDVTFGDTTIPAGSPVIGFSGSANRDPAWCSDPNKLDLRRKAPGSLVFGGGLHFCLGHALAKQELEIGLRALLTRFPGIEPENFEQKMHDGPIVRQVVDFPVHWETGASLIDDAKKSDQ
jgi:cytochrome P450